MKNKLYVILIFVLFTVTSASTMHAAKAVLKPRDYSVESNCNAINKEDFAMPSDDDSLLTLSEKEDTTMTESDREELRKVLRKMTPEELKEYREEPLTPFSHPNW